MIATAAFPRRRYRLDVTLRVKGYEQSESVVSIYEDGTATVEIVCANGELLPMDPQFSRDMAQFVGYSLQFYYNGSTGLTRDEQCELGRNVERLVGSADAFFARFSDVETGEWAR